MRNKVLGIEVIPKPEDLGGMTIAEASAEFLEEGESTNNTVWLFDISRNAVATSRFLGKAVFAS
ncbi:MAG: hypothetical protein JO159_17125 [Acidobacteria bacterium]|nr:hypothetical protein [Acidobacteriota bacterium]MBV9622692.1 hypothetical protein [Acidobacteriota bacterium]